MPLPPSECKSEHCHRLRCLRFSPQALCQCRRKHCSWYLAAVDVRAPSNEQAGWLTALQHKFLANAFHNGQTAGIGAWYLGNLVNDQQQNPSSLRPDHLSDLFVHPLISNDVQAWQSDLCRIHCIARRERMLSGAPAIDLLEMLRYGFIVQSSMPALSARWSKTTVHDPCTLLSNELGGEQAYRAHSIPSSH